MGANHEIHGNWMRVSWPGSGGRNIGLKRLAEIAATDDGWQAICELMGSTFAHEGGNGPGSYPSEWLGVPGSPTYRGAS